jgi:uncharacterized protein YjbJ (UPF0337 family)
MDFKSAKACRLRLRPVAIPFLPVAILMTPTCADRVGTELLKSYQETSNMNPSTKDQIEGKLHELKGKIKEKAGQSTNDPDLTAEGQAEKIAGKVPKKVGQIEKVFER